MFKITTKAKEEKNKEHSPVDSRAKTVTEKQISLSTYKKTQLLENIENMEFDDDTKNKILTIIFQKLQEKKKFSTELFLENVIHSTTCASTIYQANNNEGEYREGTISSIANNNGSIGWSNSRNGNIMR